MNDKIEVRTKFSYQYIPSLKKYKFTMWAGIRADDKGQLPAVFRNDGIKFFGQPLTKTWGELRNGILHAYETMEFSSIYEGEEYVKDYIASQLRDLEEVAVDNRMKHHISQYKGQEIRFYV